MTLTPPTPTLQRDRWGRPLVTPPDGGRAVAYTRCTTYVGCLEDTYKLGQWQQRHAARGIALHDDLIAAVRDTDPEDKEGLNSLVEEAKTRAGAGDAARVGTYLHKVAELADEGADDDGALNLAAALAAVEQGVPVEAYLSDGPVHPEPYRADLAAYRAATAELNHKLIEQFCVLDALKIGGTPDRISEYADRRYVADIKTGSIEWGTLKIAMQLAVYARSHTYDIATGERGFHEADTSRAIIIHLPAGTGEATLHWLDIERGWYAVQEARNVRDQRRLKFKDLTEPFGPVVRIAPGTVPGNTAMTRARNAAAPNLADQIRLCNSRAEVEKLWEANKPVWNDHLTGVAAQHIKTLEGGQ